MSQIRSKHTSRVVGLCDSYNLYSHPRPHLIKPLIRLLLGVIPNDITYHKYRFMSGLLNKSIYDVPQKIASQSLDLIAKPTISKTHLTHLDREFRKYPMRVNLTDLPSLRSNSTTDLLCFQPREILHLVSDP